MDARDVVVLVPGFLGFSRFGNFYYFADRVMVTLRGVLEERLGMPVAVVPAALLPTDGLFRRQRALLDYLQRLCGTTLDGVERIHLVGHSTGGVDAQLLACTAPLYEGDWTPEDDAVRRRIASVTTIAAPHWGTCLAESWIAYLGENPFVHPLSAPRVIATAVHLLGLLPREIAFAGLQTAQPLEVAKFLLQIARNRDLIDDLRPARMEALRARMVPRHDVPLICFVTGTTPRSDKVRPSDPFFCDLYALTRDSGPRPHAEVTQGARMLEDLLTAQPEIAIVSELAQELPEVDPGMNDGVVNTARQLVDPDEPSQVGGFVLADHADVLGHYDHRDALIEGAPLNVGLFHSGAGFGDDQFFTLYRRVAQGIVSIVSGERLALERSRPA